MDAANLTDRAATSFPFYVRKLDKKSSWGHVSDMVDDRKQKVPNAIFGGDQLRFSLYRISSVDDLKRVTIALNAGRNRLKDQVDYVAFTDDELERSDIEVINDVPGETPCATANSLHVDVCAGNYASFETLCHNAIYAKRPAFRIKKGEVKVLIEELLSFGCCAVVVENEPSDCQCAQFL